MVHGFRPNTDLLALFSAKLLAWGWEGKNIPQVNLIEISRWPKTTLPLYEVEASMSMANRLLFVVAWTCNSAAKSRISESCSCSILVRITEDFYETFNLTVQSQKWWLVHWVIPVCCSCVVELLSWYITAFQASNFHLLFFI